MTIASAIQTKQQQVVAAYTACNGKGATIPQTQDLTNLATCIASIQTGGGGDHGGEYAVTVIDYDGSVIMQDHLDTGATFTLPDAPTHSRLTFQDWAAPVNITNNTITVGKSDITIGAVYTPTSGVNEFDIVLTPVTGKTVNLRMIGSRDWGDGTTDSLTSHTYSDYGEYTIKCGGTFDTMATNKRLFGEQNVSPWNTTWNWICKNAFFASTSVPKYVLNSHYSLKNITFPNNTTIIEGPYSNYGLNTIIIPNTVTTVGPLQQNPFPNIVLGKSVSNIVDYAFWGSYTNCTKIVFPASITTIAANSFSGDYNILEYNFTNCTSIPTLSNTNAFYEINKIAKIKVPSSLVTSWKSATNWSTYSSNIEGV